MKIKREDFNNILFGILLIIPFFIPTYLEYKFSWFSKITNILLIIDYIVILICYIKNGKIYNQKFFFFYLSFFILLGIITILKNGDLTSFIMTTSKYIMMFLLYNYCIVKYKNNFLKSNLIYFTILLLINLVTIILYPKGLYVNAAEAWANWFLGYKNAFILFIIPTILISHYLDIINNKKITTRTIFIIIISLLTTLLIDSSTGIVGIGILLLGIIFSKQISKIKIFNFRNILVIYLILFFVIIIFRMQDIFSVVIEDILHRDLNFTNRIYIWDTALKYIKESFIFGYGFETSAIRVIKFNYLQAVTCHNQLLDLLYQGGIIGVTLLSGALIELNKSIKNIKTSRIKILSLVALSTYFIMMLSEYYSFNNYIFIFAIILNLSSITEERSEKNGTTKSINNNTSI